MLKSTHFNIFGLKIDGKTPISRETKEFFAAKGMDVKQEDGYIILNTGGHSINKPEIDEFLSAKSSKPTVAP